MATDGSIDQEIQHFEYFEKPVSIEIHYSMHGTDPCSIIRP